MVEGQIKHSIRCVCVCHRVFNKLSITHRPELEAKVREWLGSVNGQRQGEELIGQLTFCEFDGEWWLGKVDAFSAQEGYQIKFIADRCDKCTRPVDSTAVKPVGRCAAQLKSIMKLS